MRQIDAHAQNTRRAKKGHCFKIPLQCSAPLNGDVVFRYDGLLSALNNKGAGLLRILSAWQIHHGDLRGWLTVLSTAIVAAASVLLVARRVTA
jgi:hypothetical protein